MAETNLADWDDAALGRECKRLAAQIGRTHEDNTAMLLQACALQLVNQCLVTRATELTITVSSHNQGQREVRWRVSVRPLRFSMVSEADARKEETEAEGTVEYRSTRMFGGTPPMSFQEAKTALFPHIERPGYLTEAFMELEAMQTTKAIKKAAKEHVAKAGRDFESRRK